MTQTANLHMTVAKAAALMNVSPRLVYMAKKVARFRPDLSDEIREGRMSLHEAYCLVTNRAKPTAYDRLVSAWNAASDDDHDRFLAELTSAGFLEEC
jgi:hypothetical protein